jgi:hypothetical protein
MALHYRLRRCGFRDPIHEVSTLTYGRSIELWLRMLREEAAIIHLGTVADILRMTFYHLEPEDRERVRAVCRSWRDVSESIPFEGWHIPVCRGINHLILRADLRSFDHGILSDCETQEAFERIIRNIRPRALCVLPSNTYCFISAGNAADVVTVLENIQDICYVVDSKWNTDPDTASLLITLSNLSGREFASVRWESVTLHKYLWYRSQKSITFCCDFVSYTISIVRANILHMLMNSNYMELAKHLADIKPLAISILQSSLDAYIQEYPLHEKFLRENTKIIG